MCKGEIRHKHWVYRWHSFLEKGQYQGKLPATELSQSAKSIPTEKQTLKRTCSPTCQLPSGPIGHGIAVLVFKAPYFT